MAATALESHLLPLQVHGDPSCSPMLTKQGIPWTSVGDAFKCSGSWTAKRSRGWKTTLGSQCNFGSHQRFSDFMRNHIYLELGVGFSTRVPDVVGLAGARNECF